MPSLPARFYEAAGSTTPYSYPPVKIAASILLLGSAAPLFAFSPVLNLISPRGGQRGTEIEVRFHGDQMDGFGEALFYEPGLTLTDLQTKDGKTLVGKLAIAADAPLGEHSIRLRGPGGVTVLRSFWVGQFPTVMEKEPNNSFDQPQPIELNQTVQGVSENEDEDFFICSLKKGQRLSVEVEGMRLGRAMFDTYVAILDPRRFEVASCDDAPLLRTDSFASIIAPEDGDYRVVVREAGYEGKDSFQYRLHIGTFPRPTAIYPLGGKPGETVEFTFVGDPSGPITRTVTLPQQVADSYPVFPENGGLSSPSPHWVTVSPLEHVREAAGNADVATATAMPAVPCAADGVLSGDQKGDWFKFTAAKGDALTLKVVARALRSPLDSVLSVHNEKGAQIAKNDDQGGPDSLLNWSCPADGTYYLQVRDQLERTAPDFVYRVEIERKAPSIVASLPVVERNNSQKWKTFPVPRGNRYAAIINVSRQNIACDVVFEALSLPPGVTLSAPPAGRGLTSFPVVFEAAPDAPIGGGLHAFQIRSTGDGTPLTGPLKDVINHVEVNNQGSYHSVTLDKVPAAVLNEAPFKVDLERPPVAIVKGGVQSLKVRATRAEGYKEPITVKFLWSPPGVTAPVSLDIPGDQTELLYEINASADATAAEWPVCVLAEAKTPEGQVMVSSALTPIKVEEPYVEIAFDLAATEQGQPTSLVGKIDLKRDFAGNATAELIGLPHGATAPVQSFTKDQPEVTFPVTIAADTAVGKHTTIFCRVLIPGGGTTITHQTGKGSTLRVDKPIVPIAKNDSPQPAAAPPAAGAKPLSRLDQLRQKAQ